jgi:hypothetical protein
VGDLKQRRVPAGGVGVLLHPYASQVSSRITTYAGTA